MWYNNRKWSFIHPGSLSRKPLIALEKIICAEGPVVIILKNTCVYSHSGETHSPHMYIVE